MESETYSPTTTQATTKTNNEYGTFEDILQAVGPLGRWQLCMIVAHAFTYIFTAMQESGVLFMEHQPRFGCAGGNETEMNRVPKISFNSTCTSQTGNKCESLVFYRQEMKSTVVTEWEQVCDRAHLAPVGKYAYMAGVFIGCILGGFLGDLFGRKPVAVICEFFTGICGCLTAIVRNTTEYAILRFLTGLLCYAYVFQVFVIQQETTIAAYRSCVGGLFSIPYSSSMLLGTGLAYLLPNWRWFILAASLPIIVVVPSFYWIIDESPRWLLVHGKGAKAEAILRKAARRNGKELPASFNLNHLIREENRADHSGGFFSKKDIVDKYHRTAFHTIFHSRLLTARLINVLLNWAICGLVYYGLTWSVSEVSYEGNLFTKNAISGVIEVAAHLSCVPLLRIGRRSSTVGCMLIAGVALLFIALSPTNWTTVHLVFLYVARLTTAAHYQLLLVFTAELFPTNLRGQAVGTATTMIGLGSLTTAYVLTLRSSTNPRTPELIYGALSFFASLLLLTLPETNTTLLSEHATDEATAVSWFERRFLHTSAEEKAKTDAPVKIDPEEVCNGSFDEDRTTSI